MNVFLYVAFVVLGVSRCGGALKRIDSDDAILRPQDFGAKGDGVSDDTVPLQMTLRECDRQGGCEMLLSNGTFLSGPLRIVSGLRLNLDNTGVLRALPMQDWLNNEWTADAFLMGEALSNVSFVGRGTIEGNGEAWWNATRDDLHYRPHCSKFKNIRNLVIEDVLFRNSPNHHIYIEDCIHVRVRRLRVEAPGNSPNTDGINFAGGQDQSIVDSHISNGDDCISVVCGDANQTIASSMLSSTSMGYGGNVLVRNVSCVNGHGVSIGSVRHGEVRNVTIENVEFWRSENGPRIKTYPNNTGLVSDIVYRNIVLHDVENGIFVNGKYCPKTQKPYPCPQGESAVQIKNVLFDNIRGTVTAASNGYVGDFDCSALAPCRNITLRNIDVELSAKATVSVAAFNCSNVHGPKASDVQPESCIEISSKDREDKKSHTQAT